MPSHPKDQPSALLATARTAHAARNFPAAIAGYLRYLSKFPNDIDTRHVCAVLMLESGQHEAGVTHLNKMRDIAPGDPRAYYTLGMVALHLRDGATARTQFEKALRCDGAHTGALSELANLSAAAGQMADAETLFRRALNSAPADVAALNGLGSVLAETGQVTEALEIFERAFAAAPEIPAVAFNYAKALKEAGRTGEAVERYRALLDGSPRLVAAWTNLGNLYLDTGCVDDALDAYSKGSAIKRACLSDTAAPSAPLAGEFTRTTDFKLRHDIEQLRYLEAAGAPFGSLAADFETVLANLPPPRTGEYIVPLPASVPSEVKRTYNRALHVVPPAALSHGVINPDLDFAEIERTYAANGPGYCVVDDLLCPEALDAVRRFCLESTVWYSYERRGGYLGAFMSDGFDAPLLRQIVSELPASLPEIFKAHTLRKMWGYKYDSRMTGIPTHADFAAVNVNFWITPDDALTDPGSGGLRVFTAEAPLDWDFEKFNADNDAIEHFLRTTPHEVVDVPYKANRAVIFNSNLFHKSGDLAFREGYENRRINITMLYGKRGT